MNTSRFWLNVGLALTLACALGGCSKSSHKKDAAALASEEDATKVFTICSGEDVQNEALIAFFEAREGTTSTFDGKVTDLLGISVRPLG